MALDVGTRRIGVALTDPLQVLATPFATVDAGAGAAARLADWVQEKDVVLVVVGLPRRTNGQPGPEVDSVRAFGEQLGTQIGCPVVYIDERYTTRIAQEALRSSGASRKHRRSSVDQTAAAVILQSYLTQREHSNEPPLEGRTDAGRAGSDHDSRT